ncbi:MAG: hypothetical protein J6L85_05790, partial [Clostridia bacterium]|nr:hypothetical protein [Clostridia bacterium]
AKSKKADATRSALKDTTQLSLPLRPQMQSFQRKEDEALLLALRPFPVDRYCILPNLKAVL